MFAFAIWDEKEKMLFLARDRFGEKPLFFYRDEEEFLFASELKALWAAGVKRKATRRCFSILLHRLHTKSGGRV